MPAHRAQSQQLPLEAFVEGSHVTTVTLQRFCKRLVRQLVSAQLSLLLKRPGGGLCFGVEHLRPPHAAYPYLRPPFLARLLDAGHLLPKMGDSWGERLG